MRIFFAGTPPFAAFHLQALINNGFSVVGVFTQPDRPAGRHLALRPSAVKEVALQNGLPLWQPRGLKRDGRFAAEAIEAHQALADAKPDLLVVVAYGLLLPVSLLALIPALNVHASLLPRWRGAAPIQRAIEAGDKVTGITLMAIEEELDSGAIYQQKALDIAPDDNSQRLHDRLAALGAEALVSFLPQWPTAQPKAQPAAGVSYARKIEKSESLLDFNLDALSLAQKIMAFNPTPGAHFVHRGNLIKCWQAHALPLEPKAPPGTIMALGADGVHVACGQGELVVVQLQKNGGKVLAAADFLRGYQIKVGERIE